MIPVKGFSPPSARRHQALSGVFQSEVTAMKKLAVLFVMLFSALAFAQNKNFEIKGHVKEKAPPIFWLRSPL